MDFNFDVDPEKWVNAFEKLIKGIKNSQMKKTFIELKKELYSNLAIFRNLCHDEKLKSIKVNDSYIGKKLKSVKTAAMFKALRYSLEGEENLPVKGFNFDKLSIAIDKIDQLKILNAMSDRELKKHRAVRTAYRAKNIILTISALVKK